MAKNAAHKAEARRRSHTHKKHGYIGFQKLEGQLAQRKGVRDPGALAAAIGRKKYGSSYTNKHKLGHA